MVREILVRLPAKSVMRFKCVESYWNDLFETPSFINRHHSIQLQRRNEHRLIISHTHVDDPRNHTNPHHCMSLISDSQESEIDLLHLFPEFDTPSALDRYVCEIHLFGHCNGVFCLHIIGYGIPNPSSLILWNPATREVKPVPSPPHPTDFFDAHYCGFGADPNSNCLKIVHLEFGVQIYDLITDSWTLFSSDTLPCGLSPIHGTCLLDGVCYWRSFDNNLLISFDFRNNQLRKINLPPAQFVDSTYDFITQVDGSLAYAVNCTEYEAFRKFELWILKQDSWTKIYNVGPFDFHATFPFCISWKNGTEFIISHRGYSLVSQGYSLVSYNSYGQPLRHFQTSSFHRIYAGFALFSRSAPSTSRLGGNYRKALSLRTACFN